MKSSDLLLFGGLGVIGYLMYSKSGAGSVPGTYPRQPSPTSPSQPRSPGVSIGGGSPGGAGGGLPPSPGGYTAPRPTYPTVDPNTGTVTDSGDMCDPNSYFYDPATCASYLGTDQPGVIPDTMDPCDPNSAYYDPNQCGSSPYGNQYDSMDPCDPTSAYYEPTECYPAYDPNSYVYWGGSTDYVGNNITADEF